MIIQTICLYKVVTRALLLLLIDTNASSQVPTNGLDINCISLAANPTSWDNSVDCDSLMRKVYGATLIHSGS